MRHKQGFGEKQVQRGTAKSGYRYSEKAAVPVPVFRNEKGVSAFSLTATVDGR